MPVRWVSARNLCSDKHPDLGRGTPRYCGRPHDSENRQCRTRPFRPLLTRRRLGRGKPVMRTCVLPGRESGHGHNLRGAGPVDSGTPTDRGMNSYTGPPRIRYRAMHSGVTLIRMHRFIRLAVAGLLEGHCRFLTHMNCQKTSRRLNVRSCPRLDSADRPVKCAMPFAGPCRRVLREHRSERSWPASRN